MQKLLLGNQVRLLTDDDDVTMFQATLLHTATETEDQPQKDRSHHGRRLNIQQGQRHEAHHIPDGPKVLLGVRIAPGGEGSVHEVSGNQDIVAIYHQGRRPPEIEEKLRQMVSRPPGGNAPDGVAWPWARFVADRDGQTHGYLMQRAKPGAIPPPYSDPES